MELDSQLVIRLSTHIKRFIEFIYTNNIITIETTHIGLDNLELLNLNRESLSSNNEVKTLYSQLLNIVSKSYCSSVICTMADTVNLTLNTIFAYNYNYNYCILKNKAACKKNIFNYSGIEDKIIHDNYKNILIPLYTYPDTLDSLKIYVQWIKFVKELWKPTRICILICFDIFTNNIYKTPFIDSIITLNNETHLTQKHIDTYIFIETLITNTLFIYNLKDTIESNLFDNIMIFHNKTDTIDIKLIERQSHNPLYNYFLDISNEKQSRLCLDLQTINNLTELIQYCNLLGPYIAAIKINSNNIFNENLLKGLQKLAHYHRFIIIDDKRLVINTLDDFVILKYIYNYVDAISISLNFMDEKIEELLNDFILINKNASLIFHYNNDLDLIVKQTNYFNKFTFGLSAYEKIDSNLVSIINYKNLKKLGDNFVTMKHTDMIVLGNELYQENNPIEIVMKLNSICFSK